VLGLLSAGAALTVAGCAGRRTIAAAASPADPGLDWPAAAFDATSVDAALIGLYGTASVAQTEDIAIDLPVFAEAGAMVPVAVSTRLPDVQAIHILVKANPTPLAASFDILAGAEAFVATRVRVERSSDVVVCVRSAGRLYASISDVVVTGPDGCVLRKVPD
jgi:sulfur-oxidizing protein SoxY